MLPDQLERCAVMAEGHGLPVEFPAAGGMAKGTVETKALAVGGLTDNKSGPECQYYYYRQLAHVILKLSVVVLQVRKIGTFLMNDTFRFFWVSVFLKTIMLFCSCFTATF